MPYDPTPMGDQYYPSIKWNAAGAPYQISASGKIVYITPTAAATADVNDPVGAKLAAWAATHGSTYANPGTDSSHSGGFWHERDKWNGATNQYETGGLDWGSVMTMVVAGFLTAGMADIIMGAPAGTTAAAAANGTIPTTSGVGPLAGGYGAATTEFSIPATLDASGLAGPVAGDVVGSAVAAGTGPPTTAAVPAAAGGGYGPLADAYGNATPDYAIPPGLDPNYTGDVTNAIPNGYPGSPGYAPGNQYPNGIPNAAQGLFGLDPKWSPLLKTLAGVGGLIGGNVLGDQASQQAVPPQLTQLLDLAMQRANSQTPLYNAVNKGFYDMLPNFAKGGQ